MNERLFCENWEIIIVPTAELINQAMDADVGMMNNLLHIYGQESWHDEVFIVGDSKALAGLRDTINEALNNEKDGVALTQSFVNDGEGYQLCIVKVDNPENFDKLAVPYTDEVAFEKRGEAIYAWDIKRVRVFHNLISNSIPEYDI